MEAPSWSYELEITASPFERGVWRSLCAYLVDGQIVYICVKHTTDRPSTSASMSNEITSQSNRTLSVQSVLDLASLNPL